MVQPGRFTNVIGDKGKSGLVSPQSTGGFSGGDARYSRPRGMSNTSETSSNNSHQASQAIGGRGSPSRLSETSSVGLANGTPSSGGVSSWSKRTDEAATTPAWNIHQYGYMGGASQGNQGITFGGRRQITTPAPKVPSLAEKERKRREQEAEAERLRQQAEEAEHRRSAEREAEEERGRLAEEQRWEEETRRNREQERLRVEEEKRRWEEEERKWKEEEEARAREEQEAEARLERERQQKGVASEARPKLTGQYYSSYHAEQAQVPTKSVGEDPERVAERERVKELERELAKAKEREAQYERERQERTKADQAGDRSRQRGESRRNRSRSRSRTAPSHSRKDSEDSWRADERDYLRKEWANQHDGPANTTTSDFPAPPPQPPRPLPTPQVSNPAEPSSPTPSPSPPPLSSLPPRPLPNPANYTKPSPNLPSPQRKSPFARPSSPPTTNTAPAPSQPNPQANPLKKPPFAKPSSLLSREMELDRLRQQEWEEAQKANKAVASAGVKDGGIGPGDGSWDVNQYGYLGGDSQNRVGTGIGFGGRRQLVGPREPPGKS